jgi:PIN domain nuclease of toxin-antitoxin system
VDLLLDTQILVWLQTGDPRLSAAANSAIFDPANSLLVSSVVAWEYSDLMRRGRLPVNVELDPLLIEFAMAVVHFPGDVWQNVRALPDIHRDPVDRMLIAHALAMSAPLVTADEKIQQYPVKFIW